MVKEYDKVAQVKREVKAAEVEEQVEQEIKLAKVVNKSPKKVKKGLIERTVVALIGPDGLPAVGRYVTKEIVGPAVKNIIFDSFTNGLRMLVFKDDPGQQYRGTYYGGGYANQGRGATNYANRYRQGSSASPRKEDVRDWAVDPDQAQPLTNGTILQDWVLERQDDAVRVHEALREIAYKYNKVKVANYYELIGVNTVYTDNNFGWGWDDIDRVRIRAVRGGYILELPPVQVM